MLRPLIIHELAVGQSSDCNGPSIADLRKEGITAVIDLNQDPKELQEASKNGLVYINDPRLKIPDNYRPVLIGSLRYATMKIHQLILQGYYVYLHCSASLGRSPTIAAAYLICLGMRTEEAKKLVASVRPGAWSGHDGKYASFLEEFEKVFRSSCSRLENRKGFQREKTTRQ